MSDEMISAPHSYHTFIFPFLYQSGTKKVGRSEFAKCLHKGFYDDTFIAVDNPSKEEYDRYRYFNRAARNAIYMAERNNSAVVWNYRFDLEAIACGKEPQTGEWHKEQHGSENPARIIIDKAIKKDNDAGEEYIESVFHAELALNSVRVKLFDTGVGMLIFELENYNYPDEKTVKRINEFGRRVFVPFIKSNCKRHCPVCADTVSLMFNNEPIKGASGLISGAAEGKTDEITLSPIVKFFLSGEEKSITTSQKPADNEFCIEPIIDDRMFVACIYNNEDMAARMKEWDNEAGNYRVFTDALKLSPEAEHNVSRRFYELLFVDGDGITCLNRKMLSDLIEKHSYGRWIEYGTITGITDYSMMCVTNSFPDALLPFLSEYIEMVILALAQRASLLAFKRAISEISCKKTKLNVKDVHERYIVFQSELLLHEVTPQQQGIELYTLMLDKLFVTDHQEFIENQIDSLYDLDTSNHEKRENKILFILSVFGIFEIVSTIFGDWLELGNWWCLGIGLAAIVVSLIICFFKLPIKYKK